MRFVKQLVVVVLVALAGSAGVQAMGWTPVPTLVLGLATAALTLVAYAWVVRRTERREPVEVALKGAPAALGRGVLIGLAMFVAVLVNIYFLGGYAVVP